MKTIVFDFDGVIVDSNRLKYDSYFNLFSQSDSRTRLAIEKVLARSLIKTRYEIIQEIFRELGMANRDSDVEEYGRRYNFFVQSGISERGIADGMREALLVLAEHYALYINSGTVEEALRESVNLLGISHFFRGVYGRLTPETTKTEILKKIINLEKTEGGSVVMVGDGEADYQAAKEVGCFFIGVTSDFSNWGKIDFPLVSNLRELPALIESL